jgi:hypothetical protein
LQASRVLVIDSDLDETTALAQLSPPCTRRPIGEGAMVVIGEGAMVVIAASECGA